MNDTLDSVPLHITVKTQKFWWMQLQQQVRSRLRALCGNALACWRLRATAAAAVTLRGCASASSNSSVVLLHLSCCTALQWFCLSPVAANLRM
jgi:hypothetical protein